MKGEGERAHRQRQEESIPLHSDQCVSLRSDDDGQCGGGERDERDFFVCASPGILAEAPEREHVQDEEDHRIGEGHRLGQQGEGIEPENV